MYEKTLEKGPIKVKCLQTGWEYRGLQKGKIYLASRKYKRGYDTYYRIETKEKPQGDGYPIRCFKRIYDTSFKEELLRKTDY